MKYQIKGGIDNVAIDYKSGDTILTLRTRDKSSSLAAFEELAEAEIDCTITAHRQKRSRNANSYAWALISALAEKLNKSSVEIYRGYVQEIGIYRDITINAAAAETIKKSWSDNGLAWIAETVDDADIDGFKIVRLYYGSSVYNSAQMARLINAIIQDCKEQGIPTDTPEQIQGLIERWGN